MKNNFNILNWNFFKPIKVVRVLADCPEKDNSLVYVFDVDGTLTDSRSKIDKNFESFFLKFCEKYTVYTISGSDYSKTLEQLGPDILNAVSGVYSCSGNILTIKSSLIYKNLFKPPKYLLDYLDAIYLNSKNPFKGYPHTEDREALLCFSTVSRNANIQQRNFYIEYDSEYKEREIICRMLNNKFPELEAVISGKTSIDIYPKGKDKSQISDEIPPYTYFGDSIFPGGNDYEIANKARVYHNVRNWQQTFALLKTYEI